MKPLSAVSSSHWRVRARRLAALMLLAVANGACATPPAAVTQGDTIEIRPLPPEEQVIELRQGELPNVTLTSDVLYRLLVAEFATQRGAFVPAANSLLELAKFTSDPRLAQRAVELYMAANHYVGALDAVNVALVADPEDADLRAMRLALMAALGQTDGLSDALVKMVKSSDDKSEALAQALGILARMPDRPKALEIMTAVIDRSGQKGTMVAHMALADVAHSAMNYPLAFSHAQKALKRDPDSEDAAMRVLDYGFEVDEPAAIKSVKEFISRHPHSRRLRMMLINAYTERGQADAATEELNKMAALYPEDFDFLYIRAQYAFRFDRLDEAERLLNQYVEVQSQRQTSMAQGATDAVPGLSDAYALLAAIAERQGQPDRAVALLDRIDEPEVLYGVRLRQAKIRADQGRVDEAIRLIDATHPADQDDQLIGALTMSQILRQAQRPQEAIERLKQADSELRDSVEIKYELGLLLEGQGDLVGMERYLRRVIDLDPGYAHAFNALGYSLADRGMRIDEAYELVSRAHQLLPQDPHILDSLGWVRYRQGDLAQARRYLEQAFEIRPEPEIAAHLGEVLWELNEKDQAKTIWNKGLHISPGDPLIQETMRRYDVGS